MKKIILTLVFVFTVGSFSQINASENTDSINIEMDCYDFASIMEWYSGGGYEAFAAAYDECYQWSE